MMTRQTRRDRPIGANRHSVARQIAALGLVAPLALLLVLLYVLVRAVNVVARGWIASEAPQRLLLGVLGGGAAWCGVEALLAGVILHQALVATVLGSGAVLLTGGLLVTAKVIVLTRE